MASGLLSGLLLLACGAGAATPRGDLCLDSTFIQLWEAHRSWPAARWASLFDAFERLGVREVVVQWSEVDGLRFFDAAAPAVGPVDIILQQAERHGMHVVLGLAHDTRYWENVARPDRASYLAGRQASNAALVAALAPRLARSRSVRGWYISDEVDDLNWRMPLDGAALNTYLRDLTERIGAQGPLRSIAISGFASARTSPDSLAQQWRARLDAVPGVKYLYFQDGVGVGKLEVGDLLAYYVALAKEMRQHGGVLVPVVETFVQVAGPPVNDAKYAARPAPLARLAQQVRAARRVGKVASFGVPEYLSPEGGEVAAQAYASWLAMLQAEHQYCGPGSGLK
jgi:hypothetical protein